MSRGRGASKAAVPALTHDRPTAAEVTLHPFFWSSAQRLQFLVDASDRFEICVRDPPEPSLEDLERDALAIVGANWSKQLSTALLDDLGRFRKCVRAHSSRLTAQIRLQLRPRLDARAAQQGAATPSRRR